MDWGNHQRTRISVTLFSFHPLHEVFILWFQDGIMIAFRQEKGRQSMDKKYMSLSFYQENNSFPINPTNGLSDLCHMAIAREPKKSSGLEQGHMPS